MVNKNLAPRPRGRARVRAAILDAAYRRFNAVGYQGATIRAIARDAGVDPAMIGYYFGSKHALLGEVIRLRSDPASILTGSIDLPLREIPAHVLPKVLAAWEEPVERPALLIHIGSDPALGRVLKEFIEAELLSPLTRRLRAEGIGKRDAERRAGAFATQLVGVVFARYIVEVGPVAELAADDLVEIMAPSLASTLCGEA
ncbi:MAG: TetR family transcriptional regulator [Actinomycetia bacterium]|nr:TetR family transcriptional regulator [Actinomycetes bacterium]